MVILFSSGRHKLHGQDWLEILTHTLVIMIADWIKNNLIEIFGAVTGILYVFLEIRQTIWLWPVGIVTSAVYIWVFFTGKLYADMSLQGYYLVISILGWYWWAQGRGLRAEGSGHRAQSKERRK